MRFKKIRFFKKIKFRKFLSTCHQNWRFIFFLLSLISLISFISVFAGIVEKEIKSLQAGANRIIKRIGPVYARGIYISSWTASENERVDELIDFILRTELNAIVIDIKDSGGRIAYASRISQAEEWGTRETRIKNLEELLHKFQNHGIYTIARIAVFQDLTLAEKRPDLALKDRRNGRIWRNYAGLSWVDPASEEVWEYNTALAREALERGFNEVNFDYVRFPSDGSLQNISYPIWDGQTPKYDVICGFFAFQAQKLAGVGPRSVDLFGMTFWHAGTDYDMNIGQRLADAIPYFDYICPMLYPSHFPDNFENMANPAEYPYEVILASLEKAESLFLNQEGQRIKKPKVRPWLQAFDIGAKYTSEMILKQKQAVKDGDGYGWLLWNARNIYSSIESALKKSR